MKHITIAGKELELHYGLAFIRELDKRYNTSYQGVQYGMGVRVVTLYLIDENPVALLDIIQSALITEKKVPSEQEIEAWLEEQEDFEGLFQGFLDSLKKSKMTQGTVQKILEAAEAAELV